jgi:hypothetical protein
MSQLQQVEGQHPPPHARYVVERDGHHFIATPCYGMHHPWWVPATPNGESEPIPIIGTDRWVPLDSLLRS